MLFRSTTKYLRDKKNIYVISVMKEKNIILTARIMSNLEAPGKVTSISLEKLFTIADVLDVPPAYLLSADIIPEDRLITK